MTAAMLLAPMSAALALLCYPSSTPISASPPRPARGNRARWPPTSRRALTAGVGVAAVVGAFGPWPWWVALPVGATVGALTIPLPVRHSPADRERDRHRLAVHADLLAACLDAGMPVGSALQALARPGYRRDERPGSGKSLQRKASTDPDDPLSRLDAVAALLLLGADPERAWQGAQDHPDLAALAAAARRTAAGGAAFAAAVREHAAVLRADAADAAERSAGRAGVAITAPLGLCFLPAFLCLGLAPVVIGLLSSLHLF